MPTDVLLSFTRVTDKGVESEMTSRIYSTIDRISQIPTGILLFDPRGSLRRRQNGRSVHACPTSCVPTVAAMFIVYLSMVPRVPFGSFQVMEIVLPLALGGLGSKFQSSNLPVLPVWMHL